MSKIFKMSIGDNEIPIKDKFTLILGKFKRDLLNQLQKDNIFDTLEDFNLIPIENLINIFELQTQEYNNIHESLKLLELIKEYRRVTISNSELITQQINVVQSLISILNYNLFLKKKNILLKELDLSNIKLKSRDIAAKTDLLNKLNESIKKNKRKLKYREEDFFLIKDQRDRISKMFKHYNLKLKELNRKKKDCFNQINRITRDMSKNSQTDKTNDFNLNINNGESLSKSEKIKALQKEARDIQYEIKQINLKIKKSQFKLNEITPSYESLKKDYQSLLDIIKNDEKNLKKIQVELEEKLKENKTDLFREFDFKELNTVRPAYEIEVEIQKVESELNKILESNLLLDDKNPQNLSKIKDKLTAIANTLINNKDKIVISREKAETIECIDEFRKLEVLINHINLLINKFLSKINLEVHFKIIVSEEYKNFYIKIKFIRLNKENLNFEELTTPEKIFFVITFYISIKICLDSKYIVFSNVFLPNKYNKRGSIFRTIRKILPVFKNETDLQKFYLIFITSGLEMKKSIENLKIIRFETD